MSANHPTPTVVDMYREMKRTNELLERLLVHIAQPEENPNDLIRAEEAARLLGWTVGRSNHYGVKLRRLYRQGIISKAVPGKPWLFHRGEILQLRQRLAAGEP